MGTYRTVLVLLAVGILCGCAPQAFNAEPATTHGPAVSQALIEALKSEDDNQRRAAYDQIQKQRHDEVLALLAVAEAGIDGNQIKTESGLYAIRLLGEYRAVEAVPFLLMNVMAGSVDTYELTVFGGYACAESLVKIGKPASEACVTRLALPTATAREASVLAQVIKQVEGKEIARQRMLLAISEEKAPKKLKTLKSVFKKHFEEEKQ
jgi:hypothetical protein